MNRCSHCDAAIFSGEICPDCVDANHAIAGKCDACAAEARATVERLNAAERENFE